MIHLPCCKRVKYEKQLGSETHMALKGRLIESHVKYSTRGATPSSTLSAVSYSRSNNSVSLGKLSNWSREKFLYNFLRNNGIKEAVVVL